MKVEQTNIDSRLQHVKEILQKERPRDAEQVFNEVIENMSRLVNEDNRESLSDYLDENPTIGDILSTERVELGQDVRRNPKTIMSYLREIFEEYKREKSGR